MKQAKAALSLVLSACLMLMLPGTALAENAELQSSDSAKTAIGSEAGGSADKNFDNSSQLKESDSGETVGGSSVVSADQNGQEVSPVVVDKAMNNGAASGEAESNLDGSDQDSSAVSKQDANSVTAKKETAFSEPAAAISQDALVADNARATVPAEPTITAVNGMAHVQNVGDSKGKEAKTESVFTVGTTGRSLRMEAIALTLAGVSKQAGEDYLIRYRTHVQDVGWQGWAADGSLAGTRSRSLRIEALAVELNPRLTEHYDVWYRTHVQDIGWMAWTKNGQLSGSQGKSLRLESIQVCIKPKGSSAPAATDQKSSLAFTKDTGDGKINYRAHCQDIGWQGYASDGKTAGTTGRSKRVEALTMNSGVSGVTLEYRSHVQNVGWQGWVSEGKTSGTTGKSQRVEAISIRLKGENAANYDVWYRVHAAEIGWMDWACNGADAGTQGVSLAVEAFQVRLLPKGSDAPGPTAAPFASNSVSADVISCASLNKGGDWKTCGLGQIAGTTDSNYPLLGVKLAIPAGKSLSGSILYSAHLANIGWVNAVADGQQMGTLADDNAIEGLKISLSGDLSKFYDIYYRMHVRGMGWLGWAKNGEPAGSEGLGRAVEAYQVRLVVKGSSAPGSTSGAFVKYMSLGYLAGSIASASSSSSVTVFNSDYNLNSSAGKRVQNLVSRIRSTGRDVGFVMIDLSTGAGVACNAAKDFYAASAIKGPYVAAINKFNPGAVSSSVQSTMWNTISWSSNEGYESLRYQFGSLPMAQLQSYVGGCSFSAGATWTSMKPKDLAKLWVGDYFYFFEETNYNSAWCRSLYTDTAMSYINAALGGRYTTYTKAGWINDDDYYRARNDAGIVMAGNRPYVLAIMSTAYGQDGLLADLADALNSVHSDMV